MKLLFILLLGLGFSQTELTTRVYDISVSSNGNSGTQYDLSTITGYSLDYYILQIVQYDADSGGDWGMICVKDSQSIEEGACLRLDQNDIPFYYHNDSNEQIGYSSTIEIVYNASPGIVKLAITAEFPQEDTGYIEEGYQFCLHEGANLVSFPCDNSVPVEESLPNGIENFVNSIIGEGVATSYTASGWVGSLSSFGAGDGYWFISNSDVCFEYECVAN